MYLWNSVLHSDVISAFGSAVKRAIRQNGRDGPLTVRSSSPYSSPFYSPSLHPTKTACHTPIPRPKTTQ
ncbi:hypothetical protein DPMN_111274 [Dreissena polymorpha]|uniref:Uncharacterized protein n=1 Tax=Dreissena polymorpha TaxID=45954 RepID=A0A9D4QPM4_DREPO|nr:hypothetical protein DPMN_111274 [Dreissena polymorpha]